LDRLPQGRLVDQVISEKKGNGKGYGIKKPAHSLLRSSDKSEKNSRKRGTRIEGAQGKKSLAKEGKKPGVTPRKRKSLLLPGKKGRRQYL